MSPGAYTVFRWFDLALVVVSLIAFVVALATGMGAPSFAFLAAAVFWYLGARYWAAKARRAGGAR